MVINLATIDFAPGQGGGSDPVIRTLDVTENGTYRAPEGVDGYSPVNVNVSGGGSITPEEQAALDTLVDASEGVLYTDVLPGKSIGNFKSSDITYQGYGVCDLCNGDVYFYYDTRFLKFNKDTLNWDSLIDGYMTSSVYQGLWKDASGRFYDGVSYQIDLDTKSLVSIDTECSNFFTNNGKTNILYGQYGVWCVNQSELQKFDEDTQKFVSGYEINLPADYQDDLSYCMCTRFKYDGHILYDNGNKTYEIVEYEDHIDVVDVTDVYYKRSSFGGSFQESFIFGTDSGLFYMYDLSFYQYNPDNQTWEQLSKDITGGVSFNNKYGVTGDFVIGGIWLDIISTYTVINLGDDWKNSYWAAVKDIAVDLNSDQTISGSKTFKSSITVTAVNVNSSLYSDGTINLGQNNSYINANKNLNISVPGVCILNDKDIAVTDQCILNRSYTYPGSKFEGVAGFNGMQTGYQFYFVTPSGKLIYNDPNNQIAYEFNGTQWVQLQTVTHFVENQNSPVYLNDGLYVVNINDASVYRWDDTNSDWEFIIQAPDFNIWAGDANTLRCGNNQKLVNNGGTYQWEEEWVNNYPGGSTIRCAKLGQNYYYMSDTTVYTYDTSNLTFTSIGNTVGYPQGNHWFTYDGCMYYISDVIRKVDPSQVGTDQWDTTTNIYLTGWDVAYVEYDNKLWTVKYKDSLSYNQLGYTYNVTESVPAVPAQDGTYVLKATVLNGAVTYSWVPEV